MKKRLFTLLLVAGIAAGSVFAQQPRPQGNVSPEERAKSQTEILTQRLQLTQPQQDTIYKINLKYAQRPGGQANMSQEDRRAAFEAQRTERNAAIKAVLTPQQQAEYEKVQQEMQTRGGQGAGRGNR